MLNADEADYLAHHARDGMPVEEVWQLMDQAWDELGAGFGPGDSDALAAFYKSPVWLLNGFFVEYDPKSLAHREAIAQWAVVGSPATVVDFGGGFGALARRIAMRLPASTVTVVEEYPNPLALHFARRHANLKYSRALPESCDLMIAQDVLEHVLSPLKVFQQLAHGTRVGGHIVTANCFEPLIKCHYRGTFHLRFTFRHIAPSLGCKYVGTIVNAPHAQIFKRTDKQIDERKAARLEKISRTLYPILNFLSVVKRRL